MTDAEKDLVWRSLPEDCKKKVKRLYKHYCPYGRTPHETVRDIVEIIFGKHNLTATEEKKRSRSLTNGDKVIILSEPFVGIYGEVTDFIFDDGKFFVQVVTKIGEKLIEPQNLELIIPAVPSLENPRFDFGSKAMVCNGFNRDNIKDGDIVTLLGYDSALGGYSAVLNPVVATIIPEQFLKPYISKGEISVKGNNISSLSKEDAEELAKYLAELNDSIEEFKASQVDWLAYRMELTKDTLRYITSCSTPQEMKANELADYVITTVDGIVERLKGGEK